MTTQPQTTPDRMTAAELRVAFDHLHTDNETIMQALENQQAQITSLRDALTQISEGLTHAASASAPAPAAPGAEITFMMDTITFSTDEAGRPTYKGRGGQFAKFGIRIWPETLPALDLDPAKLVPGPNPISPPIQVRAVLGDTGQPKKVTGKA